ncbi:hypothetical protein [Streptomyces sp. NPDC093707]|uniref:hypothetical protein n=1 Tax=Streptomyces sp. NPDC093707 TaxID=3154984 RepID=UPI0034504E77
MRIASWGAWVKNQARLVDEVRWTTVAAGTGIPPSRDEFGEACGPCRRIRGLVGAGFGANSWITNSGRHYSQPR